MQLGWPARRRLGRRGGACRDRTCLSRNEPHGPLRTISHRLPPRALPNSQDLGDFTRQGRGRAGSAHIRRTGATDAPVDESRSRCFGSRAGDQGGVRFLPIAARKRRANDASAKIRRAVLRSGHSSRRILRRPGLNLCFAATETTCAIQSPFGSPLGRPVGPNRRFRRTDRMEARRARPAAPSHKPYLPPTGYLSRPSFVTCVHQSSVSIIAAARFA